MNFEDHTFDSEGIINAISIGLGHTKTTMFYEYLDNSIDYKSTSIHIGCCKYGTSFPYIIVDNGVGMNEEKMMKFTTFASTHDRDEDINGRWGLGSKSSFIYGDIIAISKPKDDSDIYFCVMTRKGVIKPRNLFAEPSKKINDFFESLGFSYGTLFILEKIETVGFDIRTFIAKIDLKLCPINLENDDIDISNIEKRYQFNDTVSIHFNQKQLKINSRTARTDKSIRLKCHCVSASNIIVECISGFDPYNGKCFSITNAKNTEFNKIFESLNLKEKPIGCSTFEMMIEYYPENKKDDLGISWIRKKTMIGFLPFTKRANEITGCSSFIKYRDKKIDEYFGVGVNKIISDTVTKYKQIVTNVFWIFSGFLCGLYKNDKYLVFKDIIEKIKNPGGTTKITKKKEVQEKTTTTTNIETPTKTITKTLEKTPEKTTVTTKKETIGKKSLPSKNETTAKVFTDAKIVNTSKALKEDSKEELLLKVKDPKIENDFTKMCEPTPAVVKSVLAKMARRHKIQSIEEELKKQYVEHFTDVYDEFMKHISGLEDAHFGSRIYSTKKYCLATTREKYIRYLNDMCLDGFIVVNRELKNDEETNPSFFDVLAEELPWSPDVNEEDAL
jgi:hypothetical protein